jgi:putative endonuclease
MRTYYVYILSSARGTLYIGVTNDIVRRVYEHKQSQGSSFTSKYKIFRLVYFEQHHEITHALQREKEIKRWRRSKKIRLIESSNPRWVDISESWFDG